jgi:DUF917 family protein
MACVRLDASNLPALARGCAVLSAGGGGDTSVPAAMAALAVASHGPVEVVDLADLPADALVMPCGLVGAPTVADERMWSGDEGAVLRDAVEDLHGAEVRALMCFGIGGANGLLPVTWAALAGLPLVDADGMGRTFPQLHQQAMHLAGVPASPVVLTDGRGNTLVLRAADDRWAERLARGAAASLGGVCAGAVYCMTAAVAREAAIAGSVSRALALAAELEAAPLIEGKVVDIERRAGDGFARGSVTIEGLGVERTRQLRVELQDEFTVALEDGAVVAAVPDAITLLATDTGEVVATEAVRFGQRVSVIVVAAPAVWQGARGLALVGPQAFGYPVDGATA